MIRRRRREGSILLSFLLFYGLMVGKYASICAMEIQKINIFNLIHENIKAIEKWKFQYFKFERA